MIVYLFHHKRNINIYIIKIRDRIDEIENFMEDNFENPNALVLEKVRTKLKKLLMYDPDHIVKLANETSEDGDSRGLVFGDKT